MEGMWTRFLPSFQFLLNIIESGTIGTVLHLHADMSFIAEKDKANRFFNPELGGGSLLDVGIYPVFLAGFFLAARTKDLPFKTCLSGVRQERSEFAFQPRAIQ